MCLIPIEGSFIGTHFIITFTPDRYGAFIDVLIDFGGYVLFMGFSYLVTFLIFKKHRKNHSSREFNNNKPISFLGLQIFKRNSFQ